MAVNQPKIPEETMAAGILVLLSSVLFAQEVVIPDPFFKACLLTLADGNQDGSISLSEAQSLRECNCQGRGIQTAEGLHYFTGLTYLNLDQNDLVILNELNALSALVVLNVGENRIRQLPDLSSLNHLESLYCASNGLDVLPLLPAGLRELRCGGNALTSIGSLPQGLLVLSCGWSALTSAPDLSGLTALQALAMGHNPFSSLPAMSHLQNLRYLELEGLGLSQLPDLTAFPLLESLFIGDNPLQQLPDFSQLPLSELGLGGLNLTSLPLLSGLNELSTLYLNDNQLAEVQNLASHAKLRFVNVSHNRLTSFPSLANFPDLCCLFLQDNEISEIPSAAAQASFLNLFFLQENRLDYGDCADLLEVAAKPGITFLHTPQKGGELDCNKLGDVQAVIPWVVQNSQYSSRISLFNASNSDTAAQLIAIDRSGARQEKVVDLPSMGVYVASSEELFGSFTGYALLIQSPSSQVLPSFLTFNLQSASGASPAQTIGLTRDTLSSRLLFAYLPGDMVPAVVLLAPLAASDKQTTVQFRLHTSQGPSATQVEKTLLGNRPYAVLVSELFGLATLPLGTAVQAQAADGTLLAGTTFVFNAFLEPSMSLPFPLAP
jgi:hypothetical protein